MGGRVDMRLAKIQVIIIMAGVVLSMLDDEAAGITSFILLISPFVYLLSNWILN